MKKIIKNKIVFFICNFLGFLLFIIILFKNVNFKGMGTFSWEKTWHNLPISIFISLVFATIMQIKRKG
jgi:hypothetical protein